MKALSGLNLLIFKLLILGIYYNFCRYFYDLAATDWKFTVAALSGAIAMSLLGVIDYFAEGRYKNENRK